MKRFEEIEHTADWAFRAYGRNLSELFENAAYALFDLQGAPTSDAESVTRRVEVAGIDYPALLVNWLSELLFLQETKHETFSHFKVESLNPNALTGQISGRPSGPLNKFVKAITYHGLKIEETPEGWQATVVVDV